MPDYMRRAFRMKCFLLVTLQLVCVFTIKAVVDHFRPWEEVLMYGNLTYAKREIFFYTFGTGTLLCTLGMHCLRERYPWNYVMLAMTTLLAGVFWGMLRAVVLSTLHFQILSILIVTMSVATVLSHISMRFISMPLLCLLAPGWLCGSLACAFVVSVHLTDADRQVVWASTGLSMLLLIILSLDAGRYLKQCKPDDFMNVVVAMNSTLMVVVSIPFFVLSFCFIHGSEVVAEQAQAAEAPGLPVSNVSPEAIDRLERGDPGPADRGVAAEATAERPRRFPETVQRQERESVEPVYVMAM